MTSAVIIASGPSLTIDDAMRNFRGRKVYAVSDAYRYVPTADVLYACDPEWWDIHEPKTRHIPDRWTSDKKAAEKYGLNLMPGQHAESNGLLFDVTGYGIIYGGNSGFQTINLAFAHGIRDALLLGFDMGHEPDEPSHFFGEHPTELQKPSPYLMWIRHFNDAAPLIHAAGMNIVNCSRRTRLECFRWAKLEDALGEGIKNGW